MRHSLLCLPGWLARFGMLSALTALLLLMGCAARGQAPAATPAESPAASRLAECLREARLAADGNCPTASTALASVAISDIQRFWQLEFAASARGYRPPVDVIAYNQPVDTPCGALALDNAVYCPLDRIVYYDPRFLGEEFVEHGEYAPVFMLAHEWGHLVQDNLGILRAPVPSSLTLELQADCFAGVYMSDACARSLARNGDIDSAVVALFDAGDDYGAAWNDPAAHGSAGQRIDAFKRGLTEGMQICLD